MHLFLRSLTACSRSTETVFRCPFYYVCVTVAQEQGHRQQEQRQQRHYPASVPLFYLRSMYVYKQARHRWCSFLYTSSSTMDFTERSSWLKAQLERNHWLLSWLTARTFHLSRRSSSQEYFTPAHQSTLPFALCIRSTCNASTWSVDTGTLGPGTQSSSPNRADYSTASLATWHTTYSRSLSC